MERRERKGLMEGMPQDPETGGPRVAGFIVFYCSGRRYVSVQRFWGQHVFLGKARGPFSLANRHLWGTLGPPAVLPICTALKTTIRKKKACPQKTENWEILMLITKDRNQN
jgi:hypothetical protein